jgi:radical SAM superfamily enzyme YgiQ (UPF0313 family)
MITKVDLVSIGIGRGDYSQFARFMPMTAVGLHYIKEILDTQGYDVKIINQTNDSLSDSEVITQIDEHHPDLVLFNQFYNTREKLRKIIPNLKKNYMLGVGGHDATFHSKGLSLEGLTKEYSQFDFIWQGEAENGLIEFMKSFQRSSSIQVVDNLDNRIEHLDQLPILKHNDYSGEIGFLSTSRGCLPKKSSCDFCTTGMFYQDGWKARSVEHIVPELENLIENGKKYVFITDDNFLGFSQNDLERGNQIIEHASRLELKLMIMTTKEQILRAKNKGYLPNWRGTLFRAFLGIENGCREAAVKLGKCSARRDEKYSEHCQKAISALYKNGIALFGGYINFNPASTIEELEESVKFLRDNGREAANFTNLSQNLRFYDGTKACQTYPQQAKSYEIRDGEFFYQFEDHRVQLLYEHLTTVRHADESLMERLDNLNYEITDLVYLNQVQDTELGKEYFQLLQERNQLNANYFLGLCQNVRRRIELDQNLFLRESSLIFNKYKKLHSKIKQIVKHQ